MLVKLTPDVNESIEKKNLEEEYFFDDDDGFANQKVHRQKEKIEGANSMKSNKSLTFKTYFYT